VIDWGTIIYGAILSGVLAGVALLIVGERRALVLSVGTVSALIAPISWNAILRATHARQFLTDAPITAIPASWQDTGSGVFTLALACLLLAAVAPEEPLRRAILRTALVCGLAAFLVDVYLY
jgi:hypothetical protein